MTGRRIGPYEVGEKLGEGGMGVVYRAQDTRLRRSVALKFLTGDQKPEDRKRFLREAQTASALNHQGIVTIYDIAEFEGDTCIVMEFIDGKPLRTLMPPGGMTAVQAIGFAIQIANAIGTAHAAGIVHRDLKPGNVIVTAAGRIKILDFGLAKFSEPDLTSDDTRTQLTSATSFIGTVAYVSPEQSMSREVGPRGDIFSLAVLLHEMLTGERPFQGSSTFELLCEINRGSPKRLRESRPDLPWSLESLTLRMLEKKPEDRIQSMEMVSASLEAIEREIQHREIEDGVTPLSRTHPAFRESDRAGEIAIAILKLRPIIPSPEAEGFAEGLASETIQALARIPGIRVASRLTASRFEEDRVNLESAARTAGIRYVLTGSIKQSGSRVRAMCELAEAAGGTQLWSGTYNSNSPDPFDAQEELARAIAAAVSGAVLKIAARQEASAPAESLDAPALVRRAHRAVFAAYSRDNIDEAAALIRRAIAAFPDYGPAHAYLGLYLQQRIISGFSDEPDRDRSDALASAERGLELAPGDAEVLQNAGLVFIHQSRSERAVRALRRAVEIAEFNLVAWGYLALALGWAFGEREMEEAQTIYDRLIRETPDHPSMPYWLYFKAGICFRQGKNAEALDCARRSIELQPQFLVGLISYANALGLMGRHEEALEAIGRVMAQSPGASEEQYLRELTYVARTPDRMRPHIAGLIAAGIFKGESVAKA